MNKQPEIGDVFLLAGQKEFVSYIYDEGFYTINDIGFPNHHYFEAWKDTKKLCKYLGKSKANINDLFETE